MTQINMECEHAEFQAMAMSKGLDVSTTLDVWKQSRYLHSHIQAMWEGWLESTMRYRTLDATPWEIRLYDRPDGVKDHYCIGRYNAAGYHEWWNKNKFCDAGQLYIGKEAANAELKKFIPTSALAYLFEDA